MKLVSNWRAVLRHAWSVRLMVLGAVLCGAEMALPLLNGVLPIPPRTFAALSFVATAGAFIARIVAQQRVSGDE